MTDSRKVIRRAWPLIAALLSAGLVILASPGIAPWRGCALFAWVALVPILAAISEVPLRKAIVIGWVAGFSVNAGLCAWFPGLIARFAGMHPLWAVLISLLIWAWQGLGWALWAGLTHLFQRSAWMPLGCAALFVVVERWMPMVFPYSLGITQYRLLWLAQLSELAGPYLLSFAFALFAGAIVQLAQAHLSGHRLSRPLLLAALAIPTTSLTFGAIRYSSVSNTRDQTPTRRIGLVQANVARSGWQSTPDRPEILQRYQDLSAELERKHGPVDLLIWPEKAYPLLLRHDALHDYPTDNSRRIRKGFQSTLLFGLNALDVETRELTNSAALLQPDGHISVVYDKVNLIPYSEWLPSFLSAAKASQYKAGPTPQSISIGQADPPGHAWTAGIFICFESTFPGYLRKVMAKKPDLLINISDDAWFGDGAEPEQHLAQAVLRAIESRRDLVRATGSGISAVVAATGQIVTATKVSRQGQDNETRLVSDVRLLSIRSVYQSTGEWFVWICGLVSLLSVASTVRRHAAADR